MVPIDDQNKLSLMPSKFPTFNMESSDDVFNFNGLPLEMLLEILSHLKHNDRLKASLVSRTWFYATRSMRFNLPMKLIWQHADLTFFLRYFCVDTSMSLPINNIHLKLKKAMLDTLPYYVFSEMRQIFTKYGHTNAQLTTDVEFHNFKSLIENLPMVKEVNWYLCKRCPERNGFDLFERSWSGICDAASKLKKISLNLEDCLPHSGFSESNDFQQRALDVMCRAPADNIIISSIMMDLRKYRNLMDQRLINLMKNVETISCLANSPIHFDFINMFGKEKLSILRLSIIDGDNRAIVDNMMDLLPNLTNLAILDFTIDFPTSRPVTFARNVMCFPELKHLHLKKDTGIVLDYQSFGRLLKSCPNLFQIMIDTFNGGKDEALKILKVSCKMCPTLKQLDFQNSIEDGDPITLDEIFTGVQPNGIVDYEQSIVNLQHLTSFVVSNHIRDFLVFDGVQMNSLKELNIGFIFMSESGIQKFVDACPNIENLYLYGDDDTLYVPIKCFEILSQLKKLNYITVSYCEPGMKERCTKILKSNKPNLSVRIDEGTFESSLEFSDIDSEEEEDF